MPPADGSLPCRWGHFFVDKRWQSGYAALALFDSNNNYLGLIVSDDLDMIEQYGKMGIPDTDVPIPQEFPLDDVATILPMAYAKQ